MKNLLMAREAYVHTANVNKQQDDRYRPMIEKVIVDAITNAIKTGNYAVSIDFESESLRLSEAPLLRFYLKFKEYLLQDLVDAGYACHSCDEILSISWRDAG